MTSVKIVSVIKVTAGGSAVHETLFPGSAHEMVSVYHLDGADLVMTHFCALGNQPRMKADPKSPANQINEKNPYRPMRNAASITA